MPEAAGVLEPGRRQPLSPVRSIMRTLRPLSIRRASLIYVFAAIFLIFSLWVPETFLTTTTLRTLLDEQAFTAIAALGLIVPLAAGVFDLAIGSEVGMGVILVAWLLSKQGLPPALAIAVTLCAGALIGLANGLLVTRARINSFIATLGISSVLTAMITWVSGGNEILNLKVSFESIASKTLFGIQYPVYYMAVVAVVVWYVLERTPVGRRVYATGGNADAARLSGIKTSTVIIMSFVVCGLTAALAGVLVSANLDAGDPGAGPGYLLPAFSAAFLGSTQFKPGRFNVAGTIVAVYVLATGVKGLQLAGAPIWIPDLFNGIALLLAVGIAGSRERSVQTAAIRGLLGALRRGARRPEVGEDG